MRRWVELEEMARLLGLISEKEKKSFCSGFGMQAWLCTKSFFLKFLRIFSIVSEWGATKCNDEMVRRSRPLSTHPMDDTLSLFF